MAEVTTGIALITAAFFAMNIGASGTAASMGVPYGGGAIRNRRLALTLAAIFAAAGAAWGGGAVVETIGSELIAGESVDAPLALIVLGAACTALFSANLLGVPLSTSEVTVGAVVGVGLAVGSVNQTEITIIVGTWLFLPAAAFILVALGKHTLVRWATIRLAARRDKETPQRALCALLVLSGCYEAFAAGMNNVANAVGPLVGAGLLDGEIALPLGGVGLALGALVLGGRVLDTSAKRITRLSLLDATLVSLVCGTLVVGASAAGIPVPLTQIATVAIMAVGWVKRGARGVEIRTVHRIVRVWLFSPLASLFLSLGAASALLGNSVWTGPGAALGWMSAAMILLAAQAQGRPAFLLSERRRSLSRESST